MFKFSFKSSAKLWISWRIYQVKRKLRFSILKKVFSRNKPTICGGGFPAKNECYDAETWTFLGKLQSSRMHSSSVVTNSDELWILGGQDENIKSLSSTEFFTGSASRPGPDLPFGLWGHQSLLINETAFILIGGNGNAQTFSTKTFYFVHDSWTPGPPLRQGSTQIETYIRCRNG